MDQDTTATITASPARCADAGTVRLPGRDIAGRGYILGGGCTWVQAARPRPSPLALPPPPPVPAPAVIIPPAHPNTQTGHEPGQPSPDGEVLDDVFGTEACP